MTEAETARAPETVEQTERLLKYIHFNSPALSSDSQLIARDDLIPLVRLFEPTAGRYGYLPDERHYPDVYFLDTLCRFSGMTKAANMRLAVTKYGYLYLARCPRRRLIMLVSAFVNDYPWFVMFPRGELAERITNQKSEVMDLLLKLQPGAKTGLAQFADSLRAHLGISLSNEASPYPELMLEWITRHIIIKPLQSFGIARLLNQDGALVDDIREATDFVITEAGRQLVSSRDVALCSGE